MEAFLERGFTNQLFLAGAVRLELTWVLTDGFGDRCNRRYAKPLYFKWWAGVNLNHRCPWEPNLQSGAIPTTLYRPKYWCARRDSNPHATRH